MRQVLMDTGIAQGSGGHIGPYLDLQAAILAIDSKASAVVNEGTGANGLHYHTSSLPILGTTWTAEVNGSFHAGAGQTAIVGYSAPLAPTGTPFGELLVDLSSTWAFTSGAYSGGAVAYHSVAVPADPTLVGLWTYTQAVIFGGGPELLNGFDLRTGY